MNLNQLRYFIAVAEQRSFTKAAAEFYLSQTAITQQISALEDTVGTRLIDRSTRPIVLTPAGTVFLAEAKGILNQMDRALKRTLDTSTGLVGTLRVGFTKGYEQSALGGLIRSFRHDFPNVFVTCFRCDTDALASGILSGEYDIIFTWNSTDIRQEDSLEIIVTEHVPLYLALYDAHPLSGRKSLTRTELKGEPIFFMSPSGSGDSFGDAYYIQLYQRAGYQPDIILRTSDAESILLMVSAEEGICIIPEYCTGNLVNVDNVRCIPLEGEGETEEILAVWRKDDPNPALRHFLQRVHAAE